MNDHDILDLIPTCHLLQIDLAQNWKDKNIIIAAANTSNWEVLSQYNPNGINYDWEYFDDIFDGQPMLRMVITLLPNQLDDQCMYYIFDDLTWESHSGGATGRLV